MQHRYSAQSRASRDVLPGTTLLADSERADWRSLLVRHSRSSGIGEPYETRPTPDQLVVLLLRGSVDIESFEDGRWRKAVFQAGSAGTTAPHEIDRLRWTLRPGVPAFEKLHLFLPETLMLEAAEHFHRPGRRHDNDGARSSLVFRDGAVAQIGGALLAAMHAGAPDFYAEATAGWLAAHLVQVRAGEDGRRPGTITDARLARALDHMSAHLADDVSLDALAAEAGVSKFHFTRLFRERVGETPVRYMTGLRLETAARLLATSDLPVAHIARECGYAGSTPFGDAFRRRYGRSPAAYRRGR